MGVPDGVGDGDGLGVGLALGVGLGVGVGVGLGVGGGFICARRRRAITRLCAARSTSASEIRACSYCSMADSSDWRAGSVCLFLISFSACSSRESALSASQRASPAGSSGGTCLLKAAKASSGRSLSSQVRPAARKNLFASRSTSSTALVGFPRRISARSSNASAARKRLAVSPECHSRIWLSECRVGIGVG